MKKVLLLVFLCAITNIAFAGHPGLLLTPADRDELQRKIAVEPWAAQFYQDMKSRVDKYLQYCEKDPKWLSSRLLMNWNTHYTVPICEKSRWVGGEGHAPVPTPRFAGARDWAASYRLPNKLEDFLPYNDQNGKVKLINSNTGNAEWVAPGETGRVLELGNVRIMDLAADAAFLYWLTDDEKYAEFATEVFWTYMYGFSFVQPPKIPAGDKSMAPIIGVTSFEVIHEGIVIPLSISYDFLYDYLKTKGRDLKPLQEGFRRFAERVTLGGSAEGNWNLNQAMMIIHAGLVLEDNKNYADGKGRQYYINILLHADLPTQRGLMQVIKTGYDPETALWPEAAGYGFGTTEQMVQMAVMLANDPDGKALLDDPMLARAILAQQKMLYPDRWSVGLGDTTNTRIKTAALELLIANARAKGNKKLERTLTAVLTEEIKSGQYRREKPNGILALVKYVDNLMPVNANTTPVMPQTYWAKPLNLALLRNGTNPETAIAAAIFGTDGGHVQSNGMAIELYGAGMIIAPDPGRGSSYWQADHAEYFAQPAAHNTVVLNGKASYPAYGDNRIVMKVKNIEPAFEQAGVSPNVSYIQGEFNYKKPAAQQERTLALIRISPEMAFILDVFRSKFTEKPNGFHDYIYHNMGEFTAIRNLDGQPLELKDSAMLNAKSGNMKGYNYFKNERSASMSNGLHASFTFKLSDKSTSNMSMWMTGNKDRRIFAVEAPANNAARWYKTMPMPTILVRDTGDAWTQPFIAVFEPYSRISGPGIKSVKPLSAGDLAACQITGQTEDNKPFDVMLLQDDIANREHTLGQTQFSGVFGTIIRTGSNLGELYLGNGRIITCDEASIRSADGSPISASLRQTATGWVYSATGECEISIRNTAIKQKLPPAIDKAIK